MSQSKVCPACQNQVPISSQRCGSCGHSLVADGDAGKNESGDKIPIGKVSGQIPVWNPHEKNGSKERKGSVDEKEAGSGSGLTEMSSTVPASNDASRPGSYVFVDKGIAARKRRRKDEAIPPEDDGASKGSSNGGTEKPASSEATPLSFASQDDVPPSVADILPEKTQRVVTESTQDLLFSDEELSTAQRRKERSLRWIGLLRRLLGQFAGAGQRVVFSDVFLQRLEKSSLPPAVTRFARRVALWHVVFAAVVLIVGSAILAAASSGGSPPESEALVQKAEAKRDSKSRGDAGKEIRFGQCSSFEALPPFPWRSNLAAAVEKAGGESLCDLWSSSPKKMLELMGGVFTFGPTGYDLLPGARIIEVYPEKEPNRHGPRMELYFFQDKLFEIRLDYEQFAKGRLSTEKFIETLGDPSVQINDQDSSFSTWQQRDLELSLRERRDDYGRVFQQLKLISEPATQFLADDERRRREATGWFNKGRAASESRAYRQAVEYFRNAQKVISQMGIALIWEARALLASEQFERAAQLAEQAAKVTRDDRVRAEAKGLLAVKALYEQDAEDAMSFFEKAQELDPAMPTYKESARELRTGQYDPQRVAKTAARLECLEKAKRASTDDDSSAGNAAGPRSWTQAGVLARGNFSNLEGFNKALELAQKDPDFEQHKKRWSVWECP